MSARGTLHLIPTPIGGEVQRVLAPALLETARKLRYFVVENEKSAWRFLSRFMDREALDSVRMAVLDEHTKDIDVPSLLDPLLEGTDGGIISEAGLPCVADPGSRLVAFAHRSGVRVVPWPGPSALLMALMASGFDGQRFEFRGYLPAERSAREKALLEVERAARSRGVPQIFIETPYRNKVLLADAIRLLKPDTRLALAFALMGDAETVRSDSVSAWRAAHDEPGKEPAVFIVSGP
ncbi:MAG: SAM-dependent methyltransferase [Spirochaetales bacterium]|nr:SAM-dependent methyltransferase [Spirochaetales bacterium]